MEDGRENGGRLLHRHNLNGNENGVEKVELSSGWDSVRGLLLLVVLASPLVVVLLLVLLFRGHILRLLKKVDRVAVVITFILLAVAFATVVFLSEGAAALRHLVQLKVSEGLLVINGEEDERRAAGFIITSSLVVIVVPAAIDGFNLGQTVEDHAALERAGEGELTHRLGY